MSKLGTWSTTAGNNNSSPPNGWPEGMAPSTVNDAARELMASIRTAFNDLQYFDQDFTPTYISATSFSVAGDQTSAIHAGRRLKIYDATAGVATTIYATVLTASFTAVTTISISADAGQLTSSLSSFALAILSNTNNSLPRNTVISTSAVATDNLTVNGTTTASGAVSLLTTLSVSGAATLKTTLNVEGATSLSGAVALGTTLSVSGATALKAALTVGGATTLGTTLSVSGATVLNSTLNVQGTTSLSGAVTLATTLTVSGAAILNSTLNVMGATSLSGAVACGTTLSVSGATALKAALSVGGAATLASTLSVGGILSVANNIAFPATQVASANANTLDDYEEGTWTPAVGGTATYVKQDGKYTKIGNTITLTFDMEINLIGTGSTFTISGLPFTANVSTVAGVAVGFFTGLATAVSAVVGGIIDVGTSNMRIQVITTTGTVSENVTYGNGSRVTGSTVYYV